jgi:hypothetical protein
VVSKKAFCHATMIHQLFKISNTFSSSVESMIKILNFCSYFITTYWKKMKMKKKIIKLRRSMIIARKGKLEKVSATIKF